MVVIAGLSNSYCGYATTYYMQEQYYEGASTVYGPYTLDAYISKFKEMAMDMATVSHNICPVQSRFNMKRDLAGKKYYPWT